MAKNRLIINHFEESIQLTWLRGQAAPRSAPPVFLEHPFDENVMAELRWYLEEYLRFPYGLEPEKAKKTEQKFQDWGQQLFELVFPRTTKAWDFFQEATREGLDQCELGISSDDPAILNLPWELLYNSDYQFLAPSLAGMYRSLNEYAVRAEMPNLPQDKLNILLVIARPYGEKDIALRTIARPLLEALKPIQKQVDLKVLRPPSFEQFERELNEHKGFYNIVHFDGHGDFDPTSQGFQHSLGGLGQGVLVFEHPDGSPQIVTAAQIAQSLTDCRVPIFILNACKSAQEGESSFSSVATRMVALGAKGVVAMAYSVYAEAAKHFIGRVYEQLVRGNTLSAAVAAGRREILNKRQRPSPKGNLPLQDWLVPVLYQQETYAPFTPSNDALDIDNLLKEPTAPKLIGFPEEGAYGFVGRDYDILRLERSLRQNSVVLLQGMAGVGKTQLACGFAQWLVETQGRSLCFFQSFEHGASLVNVVNHIGRSVWGNRFLQSSWEQQQQAVLAYLKAESCLLVWDNFESVTSFLTRDKPLVEELERQALGRFISNLQGGKSWILITSRQEEAWLDCIYTLQKIKGLSQSDAEELAAELLRTVGINRADLPSEYLDLFRLLDGHPLSLRIIIPYLNTQSPKQLIEALQKGINLFEKESNKEKSVRISFEYSFSRLSDSSRRCIPFLSLFSERFNSSLVFHFYDGIEDEFKETHGELFEKLTAQDWIEILNETVRVGMLEILDNNLEAGYEAVVKGNLNTTFYKIHPTFSYLLKEKLVVNLSSYRSNSKIGALTEREESISSSLNKLEIQLIKFYAALSDEVSQNFRLPDAKWLIALMFLEETNLLNSFRLALFYEKWSLVESILNILFYMYERTSDPKISVLTDWGLKQVGAKSSEIRAKSQDAFSLWMNLRSLRVVEIRKNGSLEEAKVIAQENLDELVSFNQNLSNNEFIYKIATANHTLGTILEDQNQLDEARICYEEALKLYEDIQSRLRVDIPHKIAGIYEGLGGVARQDNKLEDAIHFYEKALKIYQDSQSSYDVAYVYHYLGLIAFELREFDRATNYYANSIEIFLDVGDVRRAAHDVHNLGNIALKQQKLNEADSCYKYALQIAEDLEDDEARGNGYWALGNIALSEKDWEFAKGYYQKALEIYVEREDYYDITRLTFSLGLVAELEEQFDNATEYYREVIRGSKVSKSNSISADAYYHLGLITEDENLAQAIFYYQQSLRIYRNIGNDEYALLPRNELIRLSSEPFVNFRIADQTLNGDISFLPLDEIYEDYEELIEADEELKTCLHIVSLGGSIKSDSDSILSGNGAIFIKTLTKNSCEIN